MGAATAKDLKIARRNNPGANVELVDGQIVVSASASMASVGGIGGRNALSQLLQDAAVKAVEDGMAQGIPLNDTEAYLALKAAYRQRAKDTYAQLEAAAAEAYRQAHA